MILSMSGQAMLFLTTVVIGLGAGLFYDLFRILRLYIKHRAIVIHAEDLIYWLAVAAVTFYIFLNRHYGEIRGFCFVGVGLGMVIYFTVLSGFFLRAACRLINLLLKIINRVIRILTAPLRAFYRLMRKPLRYLKEVIKKVLQNIGNYVKIKMLSFRRDMRIILKKV
ncbi:MAG: spore cortex biosynthesis protein YabQ [Defluviitaleaceae bacterium]|nr:spore cortex biosynthesis protein YabQ [Defluviitaleaceae bacterium]MCL2835985.1 spore cortex biosynthesis protein YabQ [Defluviitaleaceae bacterium]